MSIKKDINLIKTLCELTTEDVFNFVAEKALLCGYKENEIHLEEKKNYLYLEGDTNYPAFVVHADTVKDYSKTIPVQAPSEYEWFYDGKQKVLWSPDLAGFDDRAGIAAILLLMEKGYKIPVIICNQEEIGGYGALKFCDDFFGKVNFKFFVELDRQGRGQSVFYDCKNSFFEYYINSFGFTTQKGIFSDIYNIAPIFCRAAVNLSIGYVDEHTYVERLFLDDFYFTFYKIEHMLKTADKVTSFKYI